MAIATDIVIEVQPGVGSDTLCSGGFSVSSKGATGVDYSTLAAAKYTYTTDLTSSGAGFTSAGSHFTNDILGNLLNVGGNFYLVTGFTSASAITVDRTISPTVTSGTGYLGGCLASLGQAGAILAQGSSSTVPGVYPTIYLKNTGTANIVSNGSANTSGNRINIATMFNVWLVGYTSNRTRSNTDTRPTVQPSANSVTCIYTGGAGALVRNIALLNPGNFTSCNGIQADTMGVVETCYASNYQYGFEVTTAGVFVLNCEVNGMQSTGSPIGIYMATTGMVIGCTVHDWTNTNGVGIQAINNNVQIRHCVVYNGKGNGYYLGYYTLTDGNVAYNITGTNAAGFLINGGNFGILLLNNIAESCVYGFYVTTTSPVNSVRMINCAGYNNATADTFQAPAGLVNFGFIALTSSSLTSPGTGDFSLNNAAGGGALLRGIGWPATIAQLTPTSYADVGAYQHAAAAAAAAFPIVGDAPSFARGLARRN